MSKYKTVAVNGCYDVLHIGHVRFLRYAANQGNRLFVGINSDASIKKLKGENRPINNQHIRREFLLNFDFINGVVIFHESDAVRFLEGVWPDVYVCGGNYNLETMNQDERKYLESIGAEIKFFPLVEGFSSTKIINKLNESTV